MEDLTPRNNVERLLEELEGHPTPDFLEDAPALAKGYLYPEIFEGDILRNHTWNKNASEYD